MLRRFLYMMCIMCMLWVCTSLFAQTTIEGQVFTYTDKVPIEMATIRLFQLTPQDTILLQGAQTNEEGLFRLSATPDGAYTLSVTNVGYVEQTISVRVDAKQLRANTMVLKPILLHEDIHALQEIEVKGRAVEMVVKGDTIEYNTAAYQLNKNAMVEDLLKKLNGVTVDKEGNVSANGETISAVRVDGKKFFGDNVQTATKNMPADMVAKVQVIDEKSEIAKMTGIEDDETKRVLNLTLKEDRKKGVFGNYSGALGADMVTINEKWFNYADPAYGSTPIARAEHFFSDDFRYKASVFTNFLYGDSQTTLIANVNNTNDVRSRGAMGAFTLYGNPGIATNQNVGVNTNIDLSKHITAYDHTSQLELSGNVSAGHTHDQSLSYTDKTSYANELIYHNLDSLTNNAHTWYTDVGFELNYQIDSLNRVLVETNFNYEGNRSVAHEDYTYFRTDSLINDGYQSRLDSTRDIGADLRLTYNRKFQCKGRSLTLSGQVKFVNTTGYGNTYAFDNHIQSTLVNQFTNNQTNRINYRLRASYVEPLGTPKHLLEVATLFIGNNRFSQKDQFSFDSVQGDYAYDSIYSNRLDNRLYTEQLELNYRWLTDQSDLTIGARVLATQTHSKTYYGTLLHQDTLLSVWNIAPILSFRYKFDKREFIRLRYRGNSTQPSIDQLEPVRNNANAMNERVGNLALQPAFRHYAYLQYSRYQQDRSSSLQTSIWSELTQDALVANTIYDQTGKRYCQTVNADIIPWKIGWDLSYNTPFADKLFQFNTRTYVDYSRYVGYVLREQDSHLINEMIDRGEMPIGQRSVMGDLLLYQALQLRFTHDLVDIGIEATGSYGYTHNNLSLHNIAHTFDWSLAADMEWHLPKEWTIATDCGYTARYGYTGIADANELIWNIAIEKTWNMSTLSLKAYDILHQRKNIVQTIGENYISYTTHNTLPTYFMLTFTYRLNRMGDQKIGGWGGFLQSLYMGE